MKAHPFMRVSLAILAALSFSLERAYAASQKGETTAEPACKASVLMDPLSGQIISEENSHEPLPPASMVKMMNAYVIFKKVKEGAINLNDQVTVSAKASKTGGSQVYLKEGEQFKVQELLEALLVQSANDAAVALAEHVAGDTSGFVEMMNVEARQLALTDSVFESPHGLPPGQGQKPDLMSAADLAKLGAALIRDFPEAIKYTGISEAPFRGGAFLMRNHNHLVRTFTGCDGIKTGYYGEAGFGVTASAEKNDMRLIAVVVGCPQSKLRDAEAARLLSSGFAKYRSVKASAEGQPSGVTFKILAGLEKTAELVTEKTRYFLVKAGEEKKIEKLARPCDVIKAPAKKGQSCGELIFSSAGQELGRVPLVLGQDVVQGGLVSKAKALIGW